MNEALHLGGVDIEPLDVEVASCELLNRLNRLDTVDVHHFRA